MKGHWEVLLGGGAGRSIAIERGHGPGGDTGNNSHWEESMGEPTSETVAKIGKAPKIQDRTPTRCAVEVVSVVCWVKERRGNHEPITQAGGSDGLTYVTGMWATGSKGRATVRRRCWSATADTAVAMRAKAGSAFMVTSFLVSEKSLVKVRKRRERREGRREGTTLVLLSAPGRSYHVNHRTIPLGTAHSRTSR